MNHNGTGRTYTRMLRQCSHGLRGNPPQRSARPGKDLLTKAQRRSTAQTRPEHDRE
jgi:hypothetical protein